MTFFLLTWVLSVGREPKLPGCPASASGGPGLEHTAGEGGVRTGLERGGGVTDLSVVEANEAVGVVDTLLHEVAEHRAGHSGHLDRRGSIMGEKITTKGESEGGLGAPARF